MPEFTDDEVLAMLKAFKKEYVDKALDGYQNAAKEELLATKYDRRAIKCNGIEVGKVSLSKGGNCPYVKQECVKEAFEFMYEQGLVDAKKLASCFKAGWNKAFARAGDKVIFQDTGEVANFLGWQDQYIKSASVSGCEYNDVYNAMCDKLDGMTIPQLLLSSIPSEYPLIEGE